MHRRCLRLIPTSSASTSRCISSATNADLPSPRGPPKFQGNPRHRPRFDKKPQPSSGTQAHSPRSRIVNASRRAALVENEEAVHGQYEATPSKGLDGPLKIAMMRREARLALDDANGEVGLLRQEAAMEDEDDALAMSFLPGTFVETRKNEISSQAVVLGESIEERRWSVKSLNDRGEVFVHSRFDVHFAIPNFVSVDLASRCGTDYLTNDVNELNARVDVLKKLKLAMVDAEASYKGSSNWERQRAVNIYQEVRSPDPNKWSKTTIAHVANLLYTRPTYINYFAAHKYLIENPLHFVATANYIKTQTLHVRPQRDVDEIKTVEKWIRQYRASNEGPLGPFITKADTVLQEYERRNDPKTGPMTQSPLSVTWDENDQLFLRFLLRSTHPYRSNQLDPYAMGRSSLMKAISPRGETISDHTTHEMLIKLGVIAPWQDLYAITPLVNPTGDFYSPDPLEKEDAPIVKKTLESKAVAGAVLGPHDLRPTDPLESVRHDFGNDTVFMIDEPTAEELDDGFSLERIPTEPDHYWIHVHIADPTAHLHPGHILCLKARDRWTTHYLAHKSFPLFPKEIVHGLGMSLGDRSAGEEATRTITFSAKVDTKGSLLDHKLRAGLIRNTRKLTYDEADLAMGAPLQRRTFPFGRPREPQPLSPPTLGEGEFADLKTLTMIAKGFADRRVALDRITLSAESVKLSFSDIPDSIKSPSMTGSVFQGFPEMEYSVLCPIDDDCNARSTVAEFMKLACRITSLVGLEHNIPLARRGADPILCVSEEAKAELMKTRSSNGYVQLAHVLNHILINPSSSYSVLPKAHYQLGLPEGEGYSRATSPLRRYEDLVMHWQLQHIMLGSNAPRRPVFDRDEMEAFCIEAGTQDKLSKVGGRANTRFFALMYLKRWMDDTKNGVERPNGDPLESLRAFKVGNTDKNFLNNQFVCNVFLPDLGMKAHLVDLPSTFLHVPMCTEVRVKVKKIELGINRPKLDVVLL